MHTVWFSISHEGKYDCHRLVQTCDYLIAKLSLNRPLLLAAEVTDVELQLFDVHFFMNRFPCLLSSSKDIIIEQFTDYQATDVTSSKAIDLVY